MKVATIVSSLVIASAAAAAAIPRQIDTSTVNAVIIKLDSVLANVEGAVNNGASSAPGSVDLGDIQSRKMTDITIKLIELHLTLPIELTEIQGLLSAIPSIPVLTTKRTVLPPDVVNELVTGVKGSVSGDVDDIAGPVLSSK